MVAQKVLSDSMVGQLLRPLICALSLFPSVRWPELSLKFLPSLTHLARAIDALLVARNNVPGYDTKTALEKSKVVESRHPYRQNANQEIPVCISGARTLTVTFDASKCSTESETDYVQLFSESKAKDDKNLTEKLFGPPLPEEKEEEGEEKKAKTGGGNWPKDPLTVSGNKVLLFSSRVHMARIGVGE